MVSKAFSRVGWILLTAQTVHPVKPLPPHCWYFATVHDPPATVEVAGADVLTVVGDVLSVVGAVVGCVLGLLLAG
jgi:hypothetical protein